MSIAQPTVLQIIPELDTGGAELSTLEITDAVVKAGGRAIVLSEGGRLVSHIVAAGGTFIPFRAATKNPLRMALNALAIAKLARRDHVDIIHARSRAPAWSALAAARGLKIPFVTTYHGAYRETNRIKAAYNSVMARGDVVIANSRYTANLIQQRYATPDQRMAVIYRGVDIAAFDRQAVSDDRIAALRSAWGVSGTEKIVLHAARLTPWKGQGDVIAAARRLRTTHPEAIYVLAGDSQGRDGYRDRLLQDIKDADLAQTVRLVGHCADMPAAFAAAYVAVVASNEPEAFGRAAAEAQAMQCPVVSTNIGAPPETVMAMPMVDRALRSGWLVPPNAPEALAKALSEALSLTADERQQMGDNARANVQKNFSQTSMQTSTLAVYDRLLGTRLQASFMSNTQNT